MRVTRTWKLTLHLFSRKGFGSHLKSMHGKLALPVLGHLSQHRIIALCVKCQPMMLKLGAGSNEPRFSNHVTPSSRCLRVLNPHHLLVLSFLYPILVLFGGFGPSRLLGSNDQPNPLFRRPTITLSLRLPVFHRMRLPRDKYMDDVLYTSGPRRAASCRRSRLRLAHGTRHGTREAYYDRRLVVGQVYPSAVHLNRGREIME